MNLSTLLTFCFALLSILSTLVVESKAEHVLDWEGKAVEVGVPYQLWLVGYRSGAIGAGSFTDKSLGHRYVIDVQWHCYKDFDGDLARILPTSPNQNDPLVSVATDYYITFNQTSWRVNGDNAVDVHNFIISEGQLFHNYFSLFQFVRVEGTEYNPHLYKLIVNRNNKPTDIILLTNKAGERSLYFNENNAIPDGWGLKISFVKSTQTNEFAMSSM